MIKLSVTLITLNEEQNLARCLDSVRWADEIVVVDSGSTDRTVEIARDYGARVVSLEWPGFGAAKQAALDQAEGEWVLSLDADEVVSPELADEIRQAITGAPNQVGFLLPRRTNFLGRWIYHCGWYPDPVLRLFRRERGKFSTALVHERVEVDGALGRLRHDLLHYSYPSLDIYLQKRNRYTTMAAEEAHARGQRASLWTLLVRPAACFVKHYLIRLGFLDGLAGWQISVLSSGYVFLKYAKLRELNRRDKETSLSE